MLVRLDALFVVWNVDNIPTDGTIETITWKEAKSDADIQSEDPLNIRGCYTKRVRCLLTHYIPVGMNFPLRYYGAREALQKECRVEYGRRQHDHRVPSDSTSPQTDTSIPVFVTRNWRMKSR